MTVTEKQNIRIVEAGGDYPRPRHAADQLLVTGCGESGEEILRMVAVELGWLPVDNTDQAGLRQFVSPDPSLA
mgnify:CR=1 FL=1